jgi:hypothetical protein
MLSEIERLIGVAVGVNDPIRGNPADGIAGLLGILPLVGMVKKVGDLGKMGRGITSASKMTLEDAAALKASLPAEFQATGAEEVAFNTLRKQRQADEAMKVKAMAEKMSNPGDFYLREHMGEQLPIDPIREARLKNASEGKPSKLRKPRD